MDTKPLEDIGLTNAEIKVYLTLLELGQTKVGPIIEKSGLQSSVVHNAIHKLQDKGLISYIKKGQIKHYKSTDPKNFIDFIEEKRKNFQKILPELLLKQKLAKEKNEAEVYEGYKGIINLLLEIIKDAKKGEEFYFFSADIEPMNKEIQNFYKKYDPKRIAKGLIVKGIAPLKLKHLFEDRIKRKVIQVKFAKQVIPPNMGIFQDKIFLIVWGEKPSGYLIYSKQLADRYKQFFNTMWNQLP
jgi:sugar-specific transcriptional regulator TrmB